jgi:hypothetical protein
LDEFYLFAKQKDYQTDNLLIHSFLDGNATVALESHCRNILEGLDGGRVDEVEEANKVHLFLITVQAK